MTDFIFMVREVSYMAITGPEVVKAVTGEEVTIEELGGAMTHGSRSGVCTFVAEDEKSCLDDVRRLLGFLPSNNTEQPPSVEAADDAARPGPELAQLRPARSNSPYDVRQLLTAVVDDGELFEYFAHWATNIVCGFARIDGHPVGIVANQPQVLAGAIDTDAAEKAARFVRTCDAFNLPLVSFVDVPGFLPGTDEEHNGIVRHGAKLLYAWSEATVARVQVVTGDAYGGAYVVMNSKSLGADLAYAWPSAEFAVTAPEGAVDVLNRRELAESADPAARRAELVKDYRERHLNPYGAAEAGLIDDVIDPADTRATLVRSLSMLRSKRVPRARRKHGNVPL